MACPYLKYIPPLFSHSEIQARTDKTDRRTGGPKTGTTDRPTDGRTDGPTDGQTYPLIESLTRN